MVTRYITTGMAAIVCAGALVTAQSQTPATQPQTPARPTTTTEPRQPGAAATESTKTMTLVGCVYNEHEVPGQRPNVAERAGIGNDFVLADATMATGALGAAATGGRQGLGTPAGGAQAGQTAAAAGRTYKLENLSEDRLRPLVGKRVEVMGQLDADDDALSTGARGTASAAPGGDQDIPDFEVTSIREVPGTCQAPAGAGSNR